MIPLRALFFSLLILLSSCVSDDRAGTLIPPLPVTDAIKRRQAALQLLNSLAARNPGSPDIFYQRARLFYENKQYTESLNDINHAIELKESVGNYFQVKAATLKALNRAPEALEAARQVEILEAGTPELYVLLGDLYQQSERYDDALQYLAKALQATPYNGKAYYYRGLVAAKTRDTAQALVLYRRALNLNPGYAPVYQQLSEVFNRLGDYPAAMQYTQAGLQRFPNDAFLLNQRGLTYQRTLKPDSALLFFRKAVDVNPSFSEASLHAGLLLFKQNDLTGALRYFENALKQNTRIPMLNNYIAQCFEYLGNFEKALEFYTIAIQVDPADYKSTNGYWRVKRRLDYTPDETFGLIAAPKPTTPLVQRRPMAMDTTVFRPILPKARLSARSDTGDNQIRGRPVFRPPPKPN
ncbi:MAG: tetratricopeptide repeat protein [Cytophagaceae bacterium]|nr:tetratricopeptide repeat protein [Cytophagaceae bacterium]